MFCFGFKKILEKRRAGEGNRTLIPRLGNWFSILGLFSSYLNIGLLGIHKIGIPNQIFMASISLLLISDGKSCFTRLRLKYAYTFILGTEV